MQSNLRHWGTVSLIIGALWLCVIAAQAEEKTIKSRAIRHLTKGEFLLVGDVQGHVVGLAARSGSATFENGEVATTTTRATFDTTKGNGTHQGYALYTFEDGSSYMSKYQGTHSATGGGKSTSKGTFVYVSGTGRFEGIQGKGTYTSKPGKDGVDLITDVVGTYTLPAK